MKKKQSYKEAILELETIVNEFEKPDIDMDLVKLRLERAMELIAFCKKELEGYKEDFSDILKDEKGKE